TGPKPLNGRQKATSVARSTDDSYILFFLNLAFTLCGGEAGDLAEQTVTEGSACVSAEPE
ncbi:MAG TPA: hypothetical protein PL037_03995, partial [Elusimicrobiales bacterium]|nr:hypothetical protein [Elusimicrobiales bacterium]